APAIDDEAAQLESRDADARACAAPDGLGQGAGGRGARVEAGEGGSDGEAELRARAEADMLGDGLGDAEPSVGGDAERRRGALQIEQGALGRWSLRRGSARLRQD